jgi:cytochrome P450
MSDQVGEVKLQLGPFAKIPSGLRRLADAPGPRGLPLFGNAFRIAPHKAIQVTEEWSREYGAVCTAKFPTGYLVLISDSGLNEAVMRARPEAFRRWSPLELVFEELSAKGLFSVEGDAWKVQRRLVMQALSQKHLRSFFPTLRRATERFLRVWQAAAEDGAELQPNEEFKRFTSDVTVSLAFSTDMNSIERGDGVLGQHLSLIFPTMGRRLNSLIPYWRFLKMPADRAVDRALVEIRKLQEQFVVDARARLALRSQEHGLPESELPPSDLLEAMLVARDENGESFSDEAIYGNMLTMLLAGEDTTAYALSWALHYLCDRPDVMGRLRAEADEVFGEAAVADSLETASRLRYAEAVAQEVLRMRSPAPVMPLENQVDIIVGDLFVPKGSAIELMTRLPAMSEKNFYKAEGFHPERWLKDESQAGAHNPRSSVPFGSGPRICPGRALALLEMRLVLSLIARHFDLKRVGKAEAVQELTAFVMTPVGIRIQLEKRQRAAA